MGSVVYQHTPSTILDLPPEILAEIFHISCDYNIIDPIYSTPPSSQSEKSEPHPNTVSVSNSDSSISPPCSPQSEESESHPSVSDPASSVSPPPFPQSEESESHPSTVSASNSASSLVDYVSQMSSLAVSMVCSTWHAIALSIPSIWACIDVRYFHDGSDPEFTQQAILHFLQMYLSRSGHHHLTLNVTGTFPQYCDGIFRLPRTDSYCYRMLDSLCKESHRWYDVTFDISPDFPDDTILSHPPFTTIRGKLPLLEKLNLAGFPPNGLVLDIFKTCPRLNSLSSFAWVHSVPRQNLKRVELVDTYDYGIIIDQALLQDLFLSCPNLNELIIRTSFFGLPTSVIPVTSMSIRSLYAAQGTYGDGKPLWSLITLPKLEKVTMKLFHGISSRFHLSITEFSSFLVRSGCNITSLTLPGLEHKCDDSIISLLHPLRLSLKRLVISETYHNHSQIVISQKLLETIITAQKANPDIPFNDALTPSELKHELFLPCLETLELGINRTVIEQLRESIQRVIQSSSVTRLRDFKLFILGGHRSALRSDSQLFDLLHSMERPKDLIYSVYYR